MTEKEWLTSDSPRRLFEYMISRATTRKVRLALCGILRSSQIWPMLTAQASRRAVEVAEVYSDGGLNLEELGIARERANSAAGREYRKTRMNPPAADLANHICLQDRNFLGYFRVATIYLEHLPSTPAIIRDVFGNPFRPPIDPSIWRIPLVVSLAKPAYDERSMPAGELDVDRLAVLSDALEDAGCTDSDLLGHLRSPGPHVRGCWALDLILGKQ